MNRFFASLLLSYGLAMTMVQSMEIKNPAIIDDKQISAKEAVLLKHPKLFFGENKLDHDLVKKYSDFVLNLEKENVQFSEYYLTVPMETLTPLAEEAYEYACSLVEKYPQVMHLVNEISDRISNETVTPHWYALIGLRIQAAITNYISDEEYELFSHAVNPGPAMLKGLTHKNAWLSYEACVHLMDSYRTENPDLDQYRYFIIGNIDQDVLESLETDFEKAMKPPLYYYLFNKGKVTIPFIIESLLNEIYLVGAPSKTLTAHGVDVSPLPFTVHDYLHGDVDPRRNALMALFMTEMVKQIKEGDLKVQSKTIVMNYALGMHDMYSKTMKDLFNLFLGKLSKDDDLTAFKKAMVGWFWILHEQPDFSKEVYATGDLKAILNHITGKKSIQLVPTQESAKVGSVNAQSASSDLSLGDIYGWDSPYDCLVSSPATGETFTHDQEIINEIFWHNHDCDDEGCDISPPDVSKIAYDINLTKRFVDVVLYQDNGKKVTHSLPTLFHKIKNMDDSIGLLNYAQCKVEKAEIDRKLTRNQREIVISKLKEVNNSMSGLVDFFLEESLKLISSQDKGTPLAVAYAENFSKLQNEYKSNLENSGIRKYETEAMRAQKKVDKTTKELAEATKNLEKMKSESEELSKKFEKESQERSKKLEQELKDLQEMFSKLSESKGFEKK